MSETRYTEDHEWVRRDDAGEAEIGITDYAQDQLGELVFIELPSVGDEFEQGAEMAVVESVKAAGDVKAPVACVVRAVNDELADEPGKVNGEPMGGGWMVRVSISAPSELDSLMDENAYAAYIESL